jgi:hypothetical protein
VFSQKVLGWREKQNNKRCRCSLRKLGGKEMRQNIRFLDRRSSSGLAGCGRVSVAKTRNNRTGLAREGAMLGATLSHEGPRGQGGTKALTLGDEMASGAGRGMAV